MSESPLRAVLEESRRRGFLGPGPVQPHLVHAQGFAEALEIVLRGVSRDGAVTSGGGGSSLEDALYHVCDLGSGGGLPGLPLLAWRSDLVLTLVDAQARRTRFLHEAITALGVEARARVLTGRVEQLLGDPGLGLREGFDVVVARSFGPPSATVEIAAQVVKPKGWILISEPPMGRQWAADGLERLGLHQRDLGPDAIAVFERTGTPPPLRRWKAMLARPAVDVGS